jgi:hypothetical protein
MRQVGFHSNPQTKQPECGHTDGFRPHGSICPGTAFLLWLSTRGLCVFIFLRQLIAQFFGAFLPDNLFLSITIKPCFISFVNAMIPAR